MCSTKFLQVFFYSFIISFIYRHYADHNSVGAIVFDEVSSLHVWLTVSSLANKDPNNHKSLVFRQLELNWINAPLEDSGDYLALYLDSEAESGDSLPVSVYKINGRHSGRIIADYYLPLVDFYNLTMDEKSAPNSLKLHHHRQQLQQPNRRNSALDWAEDRHTSSNWHRRRSIEVAQLAPIDSSWSQILHEECLGYCMAYHSKSRILASSCLRTRPNWIQESFPIIATRALSTLMIPGTHNSGTYPRQLDKSVLQMINKYQMNQDDSIFNQLVYGVRYLDLRVGYSKVKQRPERLWIYHDIFRTEVSADEVFEQVRRFLDITSHEIVIMDFHRFTVGFKNENAQTERERHAKLIELLFKHLGQYVVPSYLGQNTPLQEYVSLGKRLLVGYAGRAQLLGGQPSEQQEHYALYQKQASIRKPKDEHDIDSTKQDQDNQLTQQVELTSLASDKRQLNEHVHDENNGQERAPSGELEDALLDAQQAEKDMATRIYNKLKSLKLISHSFSKRSIGSSSQQESINIGSTKTNSSRRLFGKLLAARSDQDQLESGQAQPASSSGNLEASIAKATLFFSPVRHLWPNKDSLSGLAQYMNESTCRKYLGELRSLMVELTPTVFGAISDKYDGNRRLAQLANRPVTDWIRDRWLHCINIVASDFFLGNDLISLAIEANKMRVLSRDVGEGLAASSTRHGRPKCRQFRKIEHLIDKSKIPIQFAYQPLPDLQLIGKHNELGVPLMGINSVHKDDEMITHYTPGGSRILLRPLTLSQTASEPISGSNGQTQSRERRDSFVDNVSDGFFDLLNSFKRLLSL